MKLCPKCFEETRQEFMTKGTLFGMQMVVFNHLDKLLSLDVITNKTGADARIHVAHRHSVLRAGQGPIKGLCDNFLKHVSDVRPLVDQVSNSSYRTHSDSETRWCTSCEKRLRKKSGGGRMHEFVITMFGGMPVVISKEPDDRQSNTSQ